MQGIKEIFPLNAINLYGKKGLSRHDHVQKDNKK